VAGRQTATLPFRLEPRLVNPEHSPRPAAPRPTAETLLRTLRADGRFGPNVVHVERLPAAPARHGPWPAALHPALRAAAAALGLAELYSHQSAAIELALAGRSVALVSGTASGKSLGYTLPILDALLRDPAAHALLLFPTKALAHDQLAALTRWAAVVPPGLLRPAAYDGDTPAQHRAEIRRGANVLVTNPDMLHTGILPRHTDWAPVLGGLTHVVIDEMHVYRGVFGSHVANVLRRLRRVSAFHGAAPRFVLTSATVANPAQLAGQLVGDPVDVVADDGAPRGARTFVFYNPPVVDEVLNLRRGAVLEAEAVARHFLAGGVQTLVFARSRQAVELIVRYLSESADTPVRGYRGGYLAPERRAIEAALRDGSLRGVVATNALELGVDIGQLDVSVLAGYPGTIASLLQQAGRAGRRGGGAVAVLVAGGSALDQYILRQPEYILGQSPEHARLDPDNLLVLLDHVRCAAFELPFDMSEAERPFGGASPGTHGTHTTHMSHTTSDALADQPSTPRAAPPVAQLLAVLEAEGTVKHAGAAWYWLAEAYPAGAVSLRTSGASEVAIVRAGSEEDGRPEVLGTVSRDLAPVAVHAGAVYLHDGAAYRVTELDWAAGRALVLPEDGAVYTRASSRVDVRPLRIDAERAVPGATAGHGELEARSRATGYREIRYRTHETVRWAPLALPEQVTVSGGYWFLLSDAALDALRAIGQWDFDPRGDRGPDWPRQRELALQRDGRRCRLCGLEEAASRQLHVHHIQPFRAFGWVPGENEAWREANQLDNLMTLCPSCHPLAERALGLYGGLTGLGYALVNIAPLFLMCDPRDLGVSTAVHAPWSRRPTVVLYERVAGGVGFGETLFQLHERLLEATRRLIAACACADGCPACVGPSETPGGSAKTHALAVLAELGAGAG
jgi:DEAD/DEAH box helicase domain-containing protein